MGEAIKQAKATERARCLRLIQLYLGEIYTENRVSSYRKGMLDAGKEIARRIYVGYEQ